jgi:hypothetical protein
MLRKEQWFNFSDQNSSGIVKQSVQPCFECTVKDFCELRCGRTVKHLSGSWFGTYSEASVRSLLRMLSESVEGMMARKA